MASDVSACSVRRLSPGVVLGNPNRGSFPSGQFFDHAGDRKSDACGGKASVHDDRTGRVCRRFGTVCQQNREECLDGVPGRAFGADFWKSRVYASHADLSVLRFLYAGFGLVADSDRTFGNDRSGSCRTGNRHGIETASGQRK